MFPLSFCNDTSESMFSTSSFYVFVVDPLTNTISMCLPEMPDFGPLTNAISMCSPEMPDFGPLTNAISMCSPEMPDLGFGFFWSRT